MSDYRKRAARLLRVPGWQWTGNMSREPLLVSQDDAGWSVCGVWCAVRQQWYPKVVRVERSMVLYEVEQMRREDGLRQVSSVLWTQYLRQAVIRAAGRVLRVQDKVT